MYDIRLTKEGSGGLGPPSLAPTGGTRPTRALNAALGHHHYPATAQPVHKHGPQCHPRSVYEP
jgi:hypothetical protein